MRRLLVLAVVLVALAAPSLASACNDAKYRVTQAKAWQAIGTALDSSAFEDEYAIERNAPVAKAHAFRARRYLMTGAVPCSGLKKKQRAYMLGIATMLYKAYNAAYIGQLDLASARLDDALAYTDLLQATGYDTSY
jgi:hypothetical protein